MAKVLFKLELNFHKGKKEEIHRCLKQQLGTNENTQAFYSLLSSKTIFGWLKKKIMQIKIFRRIYLWWKRSLFVLQCHSLVKIIIHLLVYSWDLIKDVYFLIFYTNFFPISRNDFHSFGFQVFFILMLSILIPNVLNVFVLLAESPRHLTMKGKIILLCFSMVSQSTIGYAISRLHLTKEKLRKIYGKLPLHQHSENLIQNILKLEEQSQRLVKLQSKLRTNEGIYESSVQAIILLIVLAIHYRFKAF